MLVTSDAATPGHLPRADSLDSSTPMCDRNERMSSTALLSTRFMCFVYGYALRPGAAPVKGSGSGSGAPAGGRLSAAEPADGGGWSAEAGSAEADGMKLCVAGVMGGKHSVSAPKLS